MGEQEVAKTGILRQFEHVVASHWFGVLLLECLTAAWEVLGQAPVLVVY